MIPKTMKAMVLMGHGGMEQYQWREDWPVPEVGPTDVLFRVAACGLNNTDVNTRSGWYSKKVQEATTGGAYDNSGADDPSWGGATITFPRIQGADAVGEVVAVGAEADDALIGRRIMIDAWQRDWNDPLNKSKAGYYGSEVDGGFAEYALADHRNVAPVTSTLSDAELATFSCSYTTAEGMLARAQVGDADTVLIPGASGGVGGALVQLAKRRGARVIALASEAKHPDVKALGADRVLARDPGDLKAVLGDEQVTVVADIVGGEIWPRLIDILERGGRYTCSGAIAGPMVPLDLRTLYLRDLTFTGSTVVPPGIFENVVRFIEAGDVRPSLAATYPLSDLVAAQQAFIDKKHTGNIVVIP